MPFRDGRTAPGFGTPIRRQNRSSLRNLFQNRRRNAAFPRVYFSDQLFQAAETKNPQPVDYIPQGGNEPIGLSLMAGRGSELHLPRELEGGVFLGFDPTPEQQVSAELAEMITMRGGNPADVFSGIFPAEWPRFECALPRVVSNEGVVIEGVALSLPQERVRLICLDHEGARDWALGWPAWKSTSLCRGALVRDAAGILRRAELFAPEKGVFADFSG